MCLHLALTQSMMKRKGKENGDLKKKRARMQSVLGGTKHFDAKSVQKFGKRS